jgi:hypothetical protein
VTLYEQWRTCQCGLKIRTVWVRIPPLLKRLSVVQECESIGVVPRIIYTISTPTHTNNGEQQERF